ncbi:DNA primase [Natrinema sp. CGMCC1.2065]|uniref:DNA primase n=1 Tax=Natrinema sp. CGMCC1.2065 TaxID=3445767 RepID=UPI003F4A50FA
MTAEFEHGGPSERSDPERGERSARRPGEDERPTGPPRRVLTDGGQAEMEDPDDERDGSESGEGTGAAEDDGEGPNEETADEEATEDDGNEGEESAEDDEGAAEDAKEGAGDEMSAGADAAEAGEDGDERADTGDLVEDDREEGHAADAEDVYEGDDAAGVLHLDLDGLFLDVLGLEVNLNPVQLDVSARPGSNNLLGNLLSAVTGLLDGPGAMLDKAKSLLKKPLELLKTVPGKAKEALSALLERPKAFLSGLVSKPKEWLTGLLGLGGEEAGADGEAAESEDEGDAADETDSEGAAAETDEEGAGEESPGPLARAGGWLRETLSGLVPSLPVEEIVAAVVSQVIERLIERLEPEGEEAASGGEPDSAAGTEATS